MIVIMPSKNSAMPIEEKTEMFFVLITSSINKASPNTLSAIEEYRTIR